MIQSFAVPIGFAALFRFFRPKTIGMNSPESDLQILGTAKILRSRLISIHSERESEIIVRELVAFITQRPYHQLLLHPNQQFTPSQMDAWQEAEARLLAGEPLQYVTGTAPFIDLDLHVTSDVLIPRPETEELAMWVLESAGPLPHPALLDVGTGSGCIPVFLATRLPQAKIHALDLSEAALKVARKNAALYKVSVHFRQADILSAPQDLYAGLDTVVSNPPYIPTSEYRSLHPTVFEHEPGMALEVPDADPLVFYRTIARLSRFFLKPGGFIFFEIHETQGKATLELLKGLGYQNILLRKDLQGKDRMVRATWYP